MAIQIKITKKYIGNRKKYKSLEELPDDIRQAFEKAMTNSDPETQANIEATIVVNGKEYDSIEKMPPDIRGVYEKAIKALRTGKMTHDPVSLASKGMSSKNKHNKAISYAGLGPIEPQSSFSSLPRWLIIGVVLLAVFMGLSFIIHTGGWK